jgi:hypothetical protein
MSFENQIQTWVQLDNQLKLLNEKAKEIREKKNSINEQLTDVVKEHSLTNQTIEISDGSLKFVDTKVVAPLTFKYLEQSLNVIIKNESQVKQIIAYLKQNREIKIVSEIKRSS